MCRTDMNANLRRYTRKKALKKYTRIPFLVEGTAVVNVIGR